MNESPTPARGRHFAPLLGAGLLAAVVLVTAVTDYVGAERLSVMLALGQESLLATALHRALAPERGAPDAGDLAIVLDELSDQGLRYVAVLRGADEPPVAAGAPLLPVATNADAPERITGHGVVQVRRRPPARGGPRGSEGRGHTGDERGRPTMVFEFTPTLADQLRASAARSLALGLAVATILVLGGLALSRQARQADVFAARLARERHLAALGEMSAVLAHELRNPLASLKGNAQLLLETLPPGRAQDRGRWVVTEAERMEALTNDLLDFARSGAVHRAPADPAAVLHDAVRELLPAEVRVSVDAAPPTWSLDPLRVHQALTNLLRNAVQACPAPPPEARIVVEAGALVFEVRDFGAGLPEGPPDRIFEPFHTNRVRGTGLGLAVVRRVAQLHGGTATASSAPGGGAIFRVTLPPEST
ncbi:MAG: HAMP domain-containing sensor histidine kinase [Pseudomonadota bacterium]|nr:HAMP domain-containing sensor histidine kinase [Pseudomonadota bacterium]